MKEKKLKNPFAYPNNICRVEFDTKFKFIDLLDLIFEEMSLATSSYEISSSTVHSEPDDIWRYVCYFDERKAEDEIKSLVCDYLQSEITIEQEKEQDWVSTVQDLAKPVITGNFYVANSLLIKNCPSDLIPIEINAGRAFGTGEHATTLGCLGMLSKVEAVPKLVLDVGTGTGVLAIAAKKMWSHSEIIATDIDDVALEVSCENAKLNNVAITFTKNYDKIEKGSIDLIISNILATPLIEMAEDLNALVRDSGSIILSGFILNQLNDVCSKYTALGLSLVSSENIDGWQIVRFTKINNNS